MLKWNYIIIYYQEKNYLKNNLIIKKLYIMNKTNIFLLKKNKYLYNNILCFKELSQ